MTSTATAERPPGDPDAPPAEADEVWPTSGGWGKAVALILVVLVAVGGLVAVLHGTVGKPKAHKPVTVTYVVPYGTAAKVAAGKKVTIMPPEVDMRVGDTLILRNEDRYLATVGPYTVRPGEKVVQSFGTPQTLIGECSLSASGTIKIVVTA